MRITHVITRLIVGGAQENTIASVLGLRQKPGLNVDLISGPAAGPEGSLEPVFAKTPGALTLLPELTRPIHPLKDRIALRRLTEIFLQTRPDLVHTHSGKAGILGRLAAARAGVPMIVHTIHGPSFGNFQGPLPNWLFGSAERRAGKVTTHFVAVADAMIELYLAAGIGQRSDYSKIFSGFDLAPYRSARNDPDWRDRWGLAPTDFVVGKIARLFKLKGHDDLFAVAPEMARRVPQIKFLLVGDGEWRRRFETRARELRLQKHFVFTGLAAPEDIPKFVGVMDVLVHLSLREGLPRALPQAMAAGKPVIAYDCDGAKEVCFENETGFLLPPGDRPALEQRLLQLAGDPALRDRLGRCGQEFVKERFEVGRMIDDLYGLYLKLARARGMSVP
jgi:glycosyltransferase involved in cell wall biosynthesis